MTTWEYTPILADRFLTLDEGPSFVSQVVYRETDLEIGACSRIRPPDTRTFLRLPGNRP